MRVLLQVVSKAQVQVDNEIVGAIDKGLLIYLGVSPEDKPDLTLKLVDKILHLRIFNDTEGKSNLSIQDVQGSALIVSQFTLYANCMNGRRPDFLQAAKPEIAEPIYEKFVKEMREQVPKVATGLFGAYMQVFSVNEGPSTFLIDFA